MIDAIAVEVSQVDQETYAQVGAWGAADNQRQHDLAANRSLAEVNDAGADLRSKVEERVRANRANGRHAQSENENGEQQHAAPDSRHSDEGADEKTHQALDQ